MNEFFAFLQRTDWSAMMAKFALWLLTASLALLILPLPTLESLLLNRWVESNGFVLGLSAVLSASYLIAYLIRMGLYWLNQQLLNKKRLSQIHAKILTLDGQERAVLREFFLQAKGVIPMPLANNAVASLLESGVLEQTGATEHYAIEGQIAPLTIALPAKAQLTRHHLRLPEGQLDEQQKAALISARPEFINGPKRNRRQAA
ncbi:superinfection exclusion B family protein [Ferrimonas pelagia]|uniref:Superinfection exclusion B family protein n=1 Tax=Ferrimonas pelagia TaxID=1177826 RepID=A0ABP9EDS9_9GAMM